MLRVKGLQEHLRAKHLRRAAKWLKNLTVTGCKVVLVPLEELVVVLKVEPYILP